MTTRFVLALALVVAVTRGGTAGAEVSLDDFGIALPARVTAHRTAARAAAHAGDPELAAAHLVSGCAASIYTASGTLDPMCGEAQAAVARYPYLGARLAALWSCASAWSLDWSNARRFAGIASQLGAAGPPVEALAADGARGVHLCTGAVALEEGKYDEAERELATFLSQAERAADRYHTELGHTWMCRLAISYADYARASEHCAHAEALARVSPVDDGTLALVLWQRGEIETFTRDLAIATATWEHGLVAAKTAESPLVVATLQLALIEAYGRLGRVTDAERTIADYAVAASRFALPKTYLHQISLVRGRLAALRGEPAAAIPAYDDAAGSPMFPVVLSALVGRASAELALGRAEAARASLREAITRIETARARTPGDDERRRAYLDTKAEVYRALALLEAVIPGSDSGARALAAAEAGRARTLLDAIDTVGLAAPAGATRSPEQIRALLPDGTTLIIYVAATDHLLAIRVTRDEIAAVALPAAGTRDVLAERVGYFTELVAEATAPADLEVAGAALYRDLLAPVIGEHPTGTLLISADGPLHTLPFDALRADGEFLIERVDVVQVPSGSMAGPPAPHAHAPRQVLAIGAPESAASGPSLPATTAELSAIGAVLAVPPTVLGGRAAAVASFSGFRVLHFATHAIVDPIAPLHSGLLLGTDGVGDGHLRASEIYGLRISADLVVLSACRTGDGPASSSEGPLSLARAFVHAGASAVVATLWDVRDRESVAVMSELYGRLAAGRPVSQALGAAKRAMIARGARPAGWAAYVAIGHPDATPDLDAAPRSMAAWFALGFALLGGLIIAVGSWLWARSTPK